MFHIIIILFALFSSAFALQPSDQADIERIIQSHANSWNLRQCQGFSDGYANDATFVNIFGMKLVGKEEIELRHLQILQGFLKNSRYEILDISYREVQPGLVIVSERWKLEGFRTPKMDPSNPGETREGIFTHVFVQHEGKWEITASQNTIKP